jgi:hypothetical protein
MHSLSLFINLETLSTGQLKNFHEPEFLRLIRRMPWARQNPSYDFNWLLPINQVVLLLQLLEILCVNNQNRVSAVSHFNLVEILGISVIIASPEKNEN